MPVAQHAFEMGFFLLIAVEVGAGVFTLISNAWIPLMAAEHASVLAAPDAGFALAVERACVGYQLLKCSRSALQRVGARWG